MILKYNQDKDSKAKRQSSPKTILNHAPPRKYAYALTTKFKRNLIITLLNITHLMLS